MNTDCHPPSGWRSYDSVAELYERAAVPWFEPLVRDLVAAVAIAERDRVLDVGTGTGLAAGTARATTGTSGLVVGIDPSFAMLEVARSRRQVTGVRAMAPGLPFPSATFDAVVANLVLSHVPDVALALGDLARVLRPGGRLGFTAWAPEPDDHEDRSREADAVIAAVRLEHDLPSEAPVKGAPWEELLRDPQQLRDALAAAGLTDVEVRFRSYRHTFAVDDYVSGWGGLGRYLREHAGPRRWEAFAKAAAARLRERFGDTVVATRAIWIARGTMDPR